MTMQIDEGEIAVPKAASLILSHGHRHGNPERDGWRNNGNRNK